MKKLWSCILILFALILFWNQLVMQPIVLFSVAFHKLGHALTAFISGYGYNAFKVTFSTTSDTALQARGWFANFMILNGGYLGSLLFSVLIILLNKTSAKKAIPGVLAIIYLVISVSFPAFKVDIIHAVIFTALIIILYIISNEALNEFVTDVLGISVMAFIIFDTFICTLLLTLNQQLSIIRNWQVHFSYDILELSKLTNLPSLLLGIIWLAIAVFILNLILLKGSKGKSRR